MLQGQCSICGATPALGTMFHDGQQLYCPACAHRKTESAGGKGTTTQFGTVIDPTVCTKCGADNNTAEFPQVGGLPWCPTCRESLYNREYPQWLKLSLAAMLILLGYSLLHSAKYFRAGRSLYAGEKLISQRKFAEAAPRLEATLQIAPDCEKCILLFAKAKILSGDAKAAFEKIDRHNGGVFQQNELMAEVKNLAQRVERAFEKANQAGKLANEEKLTEALKLMREAQQIYPESPIWEQAIPNYEAGVAFDRKDYDEFLALSQKISDAQPKSSIALGQVASALACKYVVTNDAAFRARAEEILEKARQLAVSPEERKAFEEYQERILHRMNSRTIITKAEYDRRFRPQLAQEKPKQ